MTPLAHRIIKDSLEPKARRSFFDQCGMVGRMVDVHCFDVSEVYPLIMSFCDGVVAFDEQLAFLPAPNTWIESRTPSGGRAGFLIEEKGSIAEVRAASHGVGFPFASATTVDKIKLLASRDVIQPIDWDQAHLDQEADYRGFIYSALALINTPKIIGRRQHMPHRGLERRLLKDQSIIGKFPLHAWTEITLNVTPPKDGSGEGEHEAHLTGQKALHFCRSHLRIRLGKLEMVRAHWRGDAALGIKQSKYRVTA